MNNNVYDLHISELIRRVGNTSPLTGSNNGSPSIVITNSLNSNQVPPNYNNSVTFTSNIVNIPTGYNVSSTTHVMDFPTATPDVTGSTAVVTGSDTVILGAIGSTYTLTVTATLVHATDPNILLTSTHVITAVSPIFYGVKPFNATPDTTGLLTIAETSDTFTMTTSVVGRLIIAIPTTQPSLLSVTGPNGNLFPVSDFTVTTSGSVNIYQLNYDTQLTGAYTKLFKLNYT